MSDEWFNAICWSSLLLGIFAIKKWLVFSLTSFGTLKCDWVIKTRNYLIFCLSYCLLISGIKKLLKLHLNRKGKSISAKNFLDFIEGNFISWRKIVCLIILLLRIQMLKRLLRIFVSVSLITDIWASKCHNFKKTS